MGYRPGDLRPAGRAQEIVVVAPKHCRNGHVSGPGTTTVGYTSCDCGEGRANGHNTWSCRHCPDVIVGDGCTVQRDYPAAWPIQPGELEEEQRRQRNR